MLSRALNLAIYMLPSPILDFSKPVSVASGGSGGNGAGEAHHKLYMALTRI